jgi:hypothetical protein
MPLHLAEALARGASLTLGQRNEIYQFIKAASIPQSSLRIGDKVEKRRGYQFPGEVRGVIGTRAGEIRVVVEADHRDFEGMLHIYMPEQLMRRLR